jgi:mRNA-degrading endonuclease toxin of MazEF toxin-antitoxin module
MTENLFFPESLMFGKTNKDEADGLLSECAVNLDNIQTIPKEKIGTFITHLSPDRMRDVRAAIEFALGFDALERF